MTTNQQVPCFSDRRVVLVRPNDARVPCLAPTSECWVSHDAGGPQLLVVGLMASDESLMRASLRFKLGLNELMEFRNAAT